MIDPNWTVWLIARGLEWSYTVSKGVPPSDTDSSVVTDDLEFSWEITENRLPGHFEPSSLSFNVAADHMSDLDHLTVGAQFQFVLFVPGPNSSGDNSAISIVLTISDVSFTLDATASRRKLQAQVTAIDGLYELRNRFPDPTPFMATPSNDMGRNLAALSRAGSFVIYVPSDTNYFVWQSRPAPKEWPEVSADETIAAILNTQMLAGREWNASDTLRHTTLVPLGENTGAPDGYVDIVQNYWTPWDWANVAGPVPAYALVPLDRVVNRGNTEPDEPGGLMKAPEPPFQGVDETHSMTWAPQWDHQGAPFPVIDGCGVESPAAAKRSRGQGFTVAVLVGTEVDADGQYSADASAQHAGPLARTYGSISREIPVFMVVRSQRADISAGPVAEIANWFLSSPTELGSSVAYDAFDVLLSQMAHTMGNVDEYLSDLIFALTPQIPWFDPTLQGQTVSYAVIGNLESALVTSPFDYLSGFVTSGTLGIHAGVMTYTIEITPGDFEPWGWTPAFYSAYRWTHEEVDPRITHLDAMLMY